MLNQDISSEASSLYDAKSKQASIEQDVESDAFDQHYLPLFDRIAALEQTELSDQQVLIELEKLGLLPAPKETAIWHLMTQTEWLQLLRSLARYSPRFAFRLAESRVTHEQHSCKIWHKQPLRDLNASEIGLITSGCLWHAWETTLRHTQTRPMFRRHLADFPAIRLRLLKVLLQVLRADEWAGLLATSQNLRTRKRAGTALRFVADQIRIETQLLCGGTGYMRESPYAKALVGLQKADELLRGLPAANTRIFTPLQKKIDAAVQAKLMQIDPEACKTLSALLGNVSMCKADTLNTND